MGCLKRVLHAGQVAGSTYLPKLIAVVAYLSDISQYLVIRNERTNQFIN